MKPENRITVQEYESLKFSPHVLLDVRPQTGFDICNLPGSLNIPLKQLESSLDKIQEMAGKKKLICVCKHGNDSQRATKILLDNGIEACDIIGGVVRYSKEINSNFPIY